MVSDDGLKLFFRFQFMMMPIESNGKIAVRVAANRTERDFLLVDCYLSLASNGEAMGGKQIRIH